MDDNVIMEQPYVDNHSIENQLDPNLVLGLVIGVCVILGIVLGIILGKKSATK